MANTLRFKRGLVSTIPTAALGEPLFTTDTFDLYIGNGTTNTRFQKYIASGTTSQLLRGDGSLLTMPIVLTSPSNGQVLKYDGTNWVNSADAGVTGSGANGQVAYFTGATTQSGSNNLFWDSANARLGIGTNVPDNRLQVVTNGTKSTIAIGNQLSGTYPQLLLYGGLNKYNWSVGAQYNVNNAFEITPSTAIDGTTFSTPAITIFSNGNFGVNRTTDNGLRFQVTGDGYFSGSVGIGSTSLTGYGLRLSKTITGATTSYGISQEGSVQTDVTSAAYGINNVLNTAASTTLGTYAHIRISQNSIGAGTTITNQHGILINDITAGTSNFGIYNNINAGTNKWGYYGAGTANNYMAGSLGIGATHLVNSVFRLGKNITGGTVAYSIYAGGSIQNDVTSVAINYYSRPDVASGTTLANLYHYTLDQGTISGTVTSQYGYAVGSNMTGATNNYGFYGNIASGTGRWNLYMNGTAANFLNGNTGIGVATPLTLLHINGADPILLVKDTETGAASANARLRLAESGGAGALGEYWDVHHTGLDLAFTRSDYGEVARFSTTGNLGLGVTPSAWASTRAIQVGLSGSIANRSGGNGFYMSSNLYFSADPSNTAANGVYINSDFATTYLQANGAHRWYNAPSGTAGNAITFTQAMTLTAGGNLLVGTSTDVTGKVQVVGAGGIRVNEDGSGTKVLSIRSDFAGVDPAINVVTSNSLLLMTANTERARIDASGNLGLGVTPSAWGTRAIEVGYLGNGVSGNGDTWFTNNTYRTSGGIWTYARSAAAALYSQSGSHAWLIAPSGTAGNTITWTQAMTLDASGRLGIGLTAPTERLVVRSIGNSYANSAALSIENVTGANKTYFTNANGNLYITNNTTIDHLALFSNGNLSLSGTSDTGERLQVNGTMRVSGASTFGAAMTGTSYLQIGNAYFGKGDQLIIGAASNDAALVANGNNNVLLGTNGLTRLTISGTGAATFSSSVTATGNITSSDGTSSTIVQTATNAPRIVLIDGRASGRRFDLGSLQSGAGTFSITDATAGLARFTIAGDGTAIFSGNVGIGGTGASYKLDVTGEARVSNAISIGTTPDTNKPFKILKNINGTVGINFENTSTGSLAFSAIQMGTDVSGGTKFTNIVYSSSGVAQSGVYYPDGTSIINIGTGGLNFYSQGAPIRMFNGGGNGVLKWEMVNDSFINHYTGTAPTTSATDGYRQYSADVTAGNAAPHFRTENGAVIKLYQETTGVGNAIFSQGGGNSVLDDSTFDGYTLRQIVKALRNQGILA